MKILKLNENSEKNIIANTANTLMAGRIIIYPTETCYGIGVDATNQQAVKKLLEYKSRREGKPLSIAVSDKNMALKYVEINEIADNLYNNYLPGPITVVSKSLNEVAKGIESELNTIGIRIPDYDLILKIIQSFGKPITATSANMSYMPRPYSIPQLIKDLPKKQQNLIDLILDAGELPKNEPSTVVDTTLNDLNIMRSGAILFDNNVKTLLKAKSFSASETEQFGALNMLKLIDKPLDSPLIFLLVGELGAGKTHFTKGIAKQLKIKQIVKSPSYNLLNEYEYERKNIIKGKLVHIDLWRMESEKDLIAVDFKSYLKKGNIISIEWADKFANYFKKLREIEIEEKIKPFIITVKFSYLSETERKIESFLL